jgi:hypothetical protein
MIIKQLQPRNPKPSGNAQCCVKVTEDLAVRNRHWYEHRKRRAEKLHQNWTVDQCQQFGTIMIDDKCYCRKHAGMIALDMWIEGKLIAKEEQ